MESAVSIDPGNQKFDAFLRVFTKLTSGASMQTKALNELKQEAINCGLLTDRQRQAITARVDNYLSGNYGKTKRPEHYTRGQREEKKS